MELLHRHQTPLKSMSNVSEEAAAAAAITPNPMIQVSEAAAADVGKDGSPY